MHNDTMPYDAFLTVQKLLVKTPLSAIPHWLCLRLKIGLECHCVMFVVNIQKNVTAGCTVIPKRLPEVLLGMVGLWVCLCIC
jgi:hypothetical protein